MSLQEYAKFTCERLVNDYAFDGRAYEVPYWDIIAIIKHSLEINAISDYDVERYAYILHCTVDEIKSA